MLKTPEDWRVSANELLVGFLKKLKEGNVKNQKVADELYEQWKNNLYWAKEVVANNYPIWKVGTKANESFEDIAFIVNKLGDELKDMDVDKPELYWDKLIEIFEKREFGPSQFWNDQLESTEPKEDFKDKYLRLAAEFENFKKRSAKEKNDLRQQTKYNVLSDLLDILDDLEMAKKQSENDEGIQLILTKINTYITKQGIKEVDTAGDFDPDKHESITMMDAGEENKNKIIDCLKKGYQLDDKIVRYPKVVVGS